MEKVDAVIKITRDLTKVDAILEKYEYSPTKLITILQKTQDIFRYLPEDVLEYIALKLNIPGTQVYGVATFYSHFALKPKGKYVIKICDGTACHVKKSHGLLNALYKKLNLSSEKMTTEDLMFTVETVSCLGACGLAPVLLVNEDVYGQVTPEQCDEIVDKVYAEEKENE